MRPRFRFPWRTGRDITSDVDAELRFHLDERAESLVARGLTPGAAREQALREFGDVNDARDYMRTIDRRTEGDRRRRDALGEMRQDLAYAVRTLRASPLFTLTAVVTLALGIGANVAIFSVVHGVLLRPLPFPHAEQLYRVWSANRGDDAPQGAVSAVDLDDWRAGRTAIADMGGWFYQENGTGIDLTGLGEPQRLSAVLVTPGFFSTLGVAAQAGRLPREDEMVRGGPDKVVVLTDGFWRRQFGASASVVGSALTLGGERYQVLGVLPPSFAFPAARVDLYVPLSTVPDDAIPRIRPVRILGVVARARPGVREASVRTEMAAITKRLATQYPEDAQFGEATVLPLQESITGSVRTPLLVLLGAVAFVLLIACVNVASLLLARAIARAREMAVRAALGAGRGRLVRQLLTESVVLALAGGLAGLAVARGLLAVIARQSQGQLPRGADIRLDGTVLAFTLAISLGTGLLFGLVPALRVSASRLQQTLRAGGRGMAGGDGNRLRDGLVVLEVALAVVLVTGAGLMTRSFVALLDVDPGFRPENLVAVNFTISTARHPDDYGVFYERVIESVRAIPGVLSAGAAKDVPFRGTGEQNTFVVPGSVNRQGTDSATAAMVNVSDGYFRTLGTPVLEGREFTPADRRGAPVVVVVNRAFASRYLGTGPAVGRTLRLRGPATIVGVVGDIRQKAMDQPAEPTVYVDNQQISRVRVTLVARTRAEPLAMARRIRETLWSLDRDQTITAVFTFDDAMHEAVARPRLLLVLLTAFGALGLGLGALGIYGVLAYLVSQRPREIGVRLALGARPRDVMATIVRRGLALTSVGIGIGLVGALALGRFVAGILFGVAPADPATLGVVTVLLLAVAALGSWLPARRAAGVDPAVTLRAD